MRRWAFVVAILGMAVLALLMSASPRSVSCAEDLEHLEINARVVFVGKVVDERIIYGDEALLEFDNGIAAVCSGCDDFMDENVSVVGVVEDYEGKKEVRILRIK